MVEGERSLVSQTLNAAVAAAKLKQRAVASQRNGQQQRSIDTVRTQGRRPSGLLRTMEPADSDVEDGDSDEEQAYEKQFRIKAVVGVRNTRTGRKFKVWWQPCKDNGFAENEKTWESEQQLVADGQQSRLLQFLADRSSAC